MRCPSCQTENRDGIGFCENCGNILAQEPPNQPNIDQRIQCLNCGHINRPDSRFCANCGQQLTIPNPIPINPQFCPNCGNPSQQNIHFCENCGYDLTAKETPLPSHNRLSAKKVLLKKKLKRAAIGLGILLLFLLLLGIFTDKPGLTPVFSMNEIPLVMDKGETNETGNLQIDTSEFTVNATSNNGIQRVETYADGVLIDAQNFNPDSQNQSIDYSPSITDLPTGDHEVLVRVYDADGSTNQSSVIPINIDEAMDDEPGDANLHIDPLPANLPPSPNIETSITKNSSEIIVTWSSGNGEVSAVEIYVREPRSNGVIKIGELGPSETSIRIPVDQFGEWEILVSTKDANGNEGPPTIKKVNVPKPSSLSEKIGSEDVISYASIAIGVYDSSIDRLYAYIRIGGENNQFQRIPSNQGEFLQSTSPGVFSTRLSGYNWPVKQSLPLEVDFWGWSGTNLKQLGNLKTTVTAADLRKGTLDINSSQLTAKIQLQTNLVSSSITAPDSTAVNTSTIKIIPPPYDVHYAIMPSDCELVASNLGQTYDILHNACKLILQYRLYNFLIWKWPPKNSQYANISEANLTGFEMKYITTYSDNKILGENITAIGNADARSGIRNLSEMKQQVPCGVRKTWYIRAVGEGSASEWVYTGTFPPKECPPPTPAPDPEPSEPKVNGCGGQSDTIPDMVPDLIFESACNTHDKCYVYEWSGNDKVTCDNNFYNDMHKSCLTSPVGLIALEKCVGAAWTYYEAVNLLGRFFYEGDINAHDCWKALDTSTCLAGTTPEILQASWDIAKGGVKVSVALAKTGYSKTKDGVVWVGDKTWDGTKWTVNKVGEGACHIPFVKKLCD
ncbi:MAG TPA: hypothetical protein DIW44_07695 [Anaerolineaceae bacterium]|nr:hypothetical protein [Anaerolineaceae bacterium]